MCMTTSPSVWERVGWGFNFLKFWLFVFHSTDTFPPPLLDFTLSVVINWTSNDKKHFIFWYPLLCIYCLSTMISEQPWSNGKPVMQCCGKLYGRHKTYSVVESNTDDLQTLRVPYGSRPHVHDRRLVMCVNNPESWKSILTLQMTECPDEDLSLLDHETYGDIPEVCLDDYFTSLISISRFSRSMIWSDTEVWKKGCVDGGDREKIYFWNHTTPSFFTVCLFLS